MSVEGTVTNARFSSGAWTLNVNPDGMDNSLFFVTIEFESSHSPRLEILHKGDRLTAIGKLKDVSKFWVDLEGGLLV